MPAISRTGPILDIHGFIHPINRNYEDLPGGSFGGENFRFADLYRANLEGCNLKEADLRSCYAEGANFRFTNLSRDAKGSNGNFSLADFEGADFTNGLFLDANFSGANLKEALYNDRTQGFTDEQKRIMIAS